MRSITQNVTQWDDGRYYFYFCGDELLLNATTDDEALAEADILSGELED